MTLVIFGDEHDLEPPVIAARPGHPVDVDDLHPTRLLASTWHEVRQASAGHYRQLIRAWACVVVLMTLFAFRDRDSLLAGRFGISPAWEAQAAVQALADEPTLLPRPSAGSPPP